MFKYAAIWMIAGSLLASATSWWVGEAIFNRAPITTDEQSYHLQAELLSQGRIKYPPPPFIQPFRYPMVIVDAEQGWLSRYPPGHSFWLVPGIWLGEPYLMIALAAGVGVLLAALSVYVLGGSVVAAVLLLLVSPYYIFTYGTMMSHTSGFVAAAGMLLAYVLWRQRNHPVWAAVAGLAWAWLFLNRTYTALLIAVPFALDALFCLWRERRSRSAWAGTILFASFACGGIALILLYNYLALGHPLQMTYLYYDPTETLGFGLRHYAPVFPGPQPVEHTFAKALSDLKNNVLLLDQWLLGVRGGLVAWLILAIVGWSKRWSGLLLGSIVVVPIGYIFFWYPGWNETGPNYYFEVFPAMVVMAAMGVTRIRKWVGPHPWWLWGMCLLAIGVGVWKIPPFSRQQTDHFRGETSARAAVISTLREAPSQSLILIRPKITERAWRNHDLVFSPHGVDGDVIVARWMESSNRALLRYFHDFTPLLLVHAADGGYALSPIEVEEAGPLDLTVPIGHWHRLTGSNETHPDDPRLAIRVARPGDEPGAIMFGRYFYLYPGRFILECDVRVTDASAAELQLGVQNENRMLDVVALPQATEWTTMHIELELDEFVMLEPVLMYHGHGKVEVARIRIREVSQSDR